MFPDQVDKAVFEIGDQRRFRLPLERLPAPDDDEAQNAYDAEADADESYDGSDDGEEASDEAERVVEAASASPAIVIASRADAVGAMKAVAAFYRQAEPSHPTPLLMDKACALAQHDFMSLLGTILPDVVPFPEADS
jgi:type VI secretion system protein ImpA